MIAGLGETEKELLTAVQKVFDLGVLPALFAFTPVRGTVLEGMNQPEVGSYRRVQLARYLIVAGLVRLSDMGFDAEGKIVDFGLDCTRLNEIVDSGKPFLTSGCADCNRPFYNEEDLVVRCTIILEA